MVLHSNSCQLSAIGEVADSVRREKIQVSERDDIVLRRKATVLRIVASATETDNRKKRQLIINHKLIPRLFQKGKYKTNDRLCIQKSNDCFRAAENLKPRRPDDTTGSSRCPSHLPCRLEVIDRQNGLFRTTWLTNDNMNVSLVLLGSYWFVSLQTSPW